MDVSFTELDYAPESIPNPDFCRIAAESSVLCRIHKSIPEKCVTFEGTNTGRRFYCCAHKNVSYMSIYFMVFNFLSELSIHIFWWQVRPAVNWCQLVQLLIKTRAKYCSNQCKLFLYLTCFVQNCYVTPPVSKYKMFWQHKLNFHNILYLGTEEVLSQVNECEKWTRNIQC
jgi:hypothetical protein